MKLLRKVKKHVKRRLWAAMLKGWPNGEVE